MWLFRIPVDQGIRDFMFEENGWVFRFKQYSKFGTASLKSPVQKEVSQSGAPTVRYVKYNVFCVGRVKNRDSFCGIAFCDFPMRLLIPSLILCGAGLGTEAITTGIFFSALFYLLESALSISKDKMLMSMLKRRMQFLPYH